MAFKQTRLKKVVLVSMTLIISVLLINQINIIFDLKNSENNVATTSILSNQSSISSPPMAAKDIIRSILNLPLFDQILIRHTMFPNPASNHVTMNQTSPIVQKLIREIQKIHVVDQQEIQDVLFFEREFPYPLKCPMNRMEVNDQLPFSIVVVIHIAMINNWKDIVKDQLLTINNCGIGQALPNLIVTYTQNNTNNTLEHLQDIIRYYPFYNATTFVHASNKIPYEATALNTLRDYCIAESDRNHSSTSSLSETIAFYIHSKGVSKYQQNWKTSMNLTNPNMYTVILFWRKYMEFFLLERPYLCIDKIMNHGARACGVNHIHIPNTWIKPHFSGNFWAASCRYVTELNKLELKKGDRWAYYKAEMWLGDHPDAINQTKFLSLFQHNASISHQYDRIVMPSEYTDVYETNKTYD